MAEAASRPRSGRVPVTCRIVVPAGATRAQITEIVEGWRSRVAIDLDERYEPIPVRPPREERAKFEKSKLQLVIVRCFIDPEQIATLQRLPAVHHVARDSRVGPFAHWQVQSAATIKPATRVHCADDAPVGTAAAVASDLGVTDIWRAGYTGRGMVVGLVDGGISAHARPTQPHVVPAIPQDPATGDVIGGWPADWGTTADGWGQHGNMIAFAVQAMAPDAELWDVRIWESGAEFEVFVSNAESGFRAAIDSYQARGYPHVLVNSWGLYDSDNGADYAFNPRSNIALLVEEALDAGIFVLFAAGNCGDGCVFPAGTTCGSGDRGPGSSILGPNGHPEVMTVGAATLHGDWCGFTSQGPAVLPPNDPDKPDFCAPSQFEGYFPNDSGLRPCDGGTSAANGIAAGVVTLLKQVRPDLTQEECKRLLKDTARPIRGLPPPDSTGAGLIHALRAFRSL